MLRLAPSIIALGVILALLYFGRVFFVTAVFAVIISFILDPFVHLLMKLRLPRALASLLVCTLGALVLYAACMALYAQMSGLLTQLPQIGERVAGMVDNVQQQVDKFEGTAYKLVSKRPLPAVVPKAVPAPRKRLSAPLPQVPPPIQEVRIHQDSNPIGDFIYPRLASLYEVLLMGSFLPFLVYFLLSWGDHMNRSFLQFFQGEDRVMAAKSLQGIGDMVRAFVVGNSILGVLLACVSTMGFWLISLPFPLLAGPLSGFLSLFPYVGLPLALIPPMLAALGGPTTVGGILIVFVIVAGLHLTALNVLYPKLVGARVHLNPLVVTIALMFWSFMWDGAGLILAIPLTAGIKAVCDNVRTLRPFGRFLGD